MPPKEQLNPRRQLTSRHVADNQHHLCAFVIDRLTERPDLADVRTGVIYEHLRNHAVVPAPAARA